MITGDDDPPKMIGAKRHRVMTNNMDLSTVKKELLRQVKLDSNDSFIDEVVCLSVCHTLGEEPLTGVVVLCNRQNKIEIKNTKMNPVYSSINVINFVCGHKVSGTVLYHATIYCFVYEHCITVNLTFCSFEGLPVNCCIDDTGVIQLALRQQYPFCQESSCKWKRMLFVFLFTALTLNVR